VGQASPSAVAQTLLTWDERIDRARALAATHSPASQILMFYAGLAEYQRSLAESSSPVSSQAPDFSGVIDFATTGSAVRSFLEWLRHNAPAPLAGAAAEAGRVSIEQWRDLMRRRATDDDVDSPDDDAPTGFVVEAVLQPFAERAAVALRQMRGPANSTAGARASRCPICGSRPVVAALREEGHGAKRTLICALCLTEWDYLRVRCPACDEERFDALPVYTADTLPHVRVDACDSCHIYMKTVDLTKNGLAVPLVDDLATVPLDLWAREHGYHRLRANLLRV
jgi:FdhE protein